MVEDEQDKRHNLLSCLFFPLHFWITVDIIVVSNR